MKGLRQHVVAEPVPQRRRVLIIVENLPVPFDRRVWSEATALRDAGYTVSVICPCGRGMEDRFENIGDIHVFRHWLPEARGKLGYAVEYGVATFWQFILSIRVARRRGFDIIHACNPPDTIFLVALVYRVLWGTIFIFDHHDINPELYEAKFGRRGWFWSVLVLLERLTFRTCDVSIATNESYRQIAIGRGGMKPERVFVVRSGPDLNRIQAVVPDEDWKNGKRFLVAYVGVIGAQEGLDLLMSAAERLRKLRRDDVQFVIVGSGPELSSVKALAERLGLLDCVTFTGRVSDDVLMSVLSTADVCVNPDRPNVMNNLSTMNKIMEYMAMGKPIVQFDLLEGRASALDASLYVPHGDTDAFAKSISFLLDCPERRKAMGEFGKARVENELSWPHEMPKLLAAYEAAFRRV